MMTTKRAGVAATLVFSLWTVGCGSDADPGSTPESEVEGTVLITEFGSGTPADAEVCLEQTGDCVMTDAEGRASMTLPAESDLSITLDAPGMYPMLLTLRTPGEGGEIALEMFRVELLEAVLELAGATVDNTKGHLLHALDAPGAQIDIAPSSGVGPLYGDGGVVSDELDAIPEGEAVGWAWGNVEPGELTVNISPNGLSCAPAELGWSGTTSTTIVSEAVAGRLTLIPAAACTP